MIKHSIITLFICFIIILQTSSQEFDNNGINEIQAIELAEEYLGIS